MGDVTNVSRAKEAPCMLGCAGSGGGGVMVISSAAIPSVCRQLDLTTDLYLLHIHNLRVLCDMYAMVQRVKDDTDPESKEALIQHASTLLGCPPVDTSKVGPHGIYQT